MREYFTLEQYDEDWFIRRKSDGMLFAWFNNADIACRVPAELENYATELALLEDFRVELRKIIGGTT